MTRGRKLNKAAMARAVEAIRKGCTYKLAANAAGVSEYMSTTSARDSPVEDAGPVPCMKCRHACQLGGRGCRTRHSGGSCQRVVRAANVHSDRQDGRCDWCLWLIRGGYTGALSTPLAKRRRIIAAHERRDDAVILALRAAESRFRGQKGFRLGIVILRVDGLARHYRDVLVVVAIIPSASISCG